MSKQFFVFICFIFQVSIVFSQNRTNYNCKSTDGTIILTETHLVVLNAKNKGEAQELIIGNNVSLNNLFRVYSDVTIQGMGYVKNLKLVEDKGVVSENLAPRCEGGVGAGSQTKGYTIEARVALSKQIDKIVELNCLETSSWIDTCNYNN